MIIDRLFLEVADLEALSHGMFVYLHMKERCVIDSQPHIDSNISYVYRVYEIYYFVDLFLLNFFRLIYSLA